MAQIVLPRPPADEEELWWVIKTLFGVELPRVAVCDGHVSPFHAVAHAYFGKAPNYAVWYASRGSGKSLALAVLGLTKSFVLDVDVTILGGSMTQSKNVAEHMAKLMAAPNAPVHAMEKRTATELRLHTQRTIRPLPASQTTVRGPHPPLQLLDEVDEMEMAIYDASMGQAMEQDNHWGQTVAEYIVASSTWQNPEGTFTEVIDRARRNGSPVFTWCWRELIKNDKNPTGWMTQRFIDSKRKTVSAQMWRCLPTGVLVQTRRGEVAIQDIKDGDEVWTRQGWRAVTALVPQPERPIYTVTTDDGRSVRASGNHPFAVPGGWARADGLAVGDVLITAEPPLMLAGAGLAHPVAFSVDEAVDGADVAVDAQLASGVAVAFGSVGSPAQQGQVIGGDAPGDVAVVLDRQPLRDVALPSDEGHSVGVAAAACQTADAVAVLGRGAGPQPTPRLGWSRPLPDVALMVGDARLGLVDDEARSAPSNTATSDFGAAVDTGECRVASVLAGAPMPTWDLSIDGCHEFTVQGVLVHNTEYELNEPSGASRAFDLDALEEYFVPYPAALRHVNKGDEEQSWTWEEPTVFGTYVVGADWAKEQDLTVIAVLRVDLKPYRLVKLTVINRRPYPVMIGMFNRDKERYHAAGATHDKTGLGNVVDDYVEFSDTVEGFNMVGRPRTQMLLDYISAVEHGDYQLPNGPVEGQVDDAGNAVVDEQLAYLKRSHRGTTVADVYAPGKWNSHLPDRVSAMALAHRALTRLALPAIESVGVPKSDAVRAVDKPFHAVPFEDSRTEGGVTIVEERYDEGPATKGEDLFGLLVGSGEPSYLA